MFWSFALSDTFGINSSTKKPKLKNKKIKKVSEIGQGSIGQSSTKIKGGKLKTLE